MDEALGKLKRTQGYLVDAIDDGIWDWNLSTGEVNCSDRWGAILGYAPGEIESTRESFDRLVFVEDKERVQARIQECIGDGTVYDCDFRMYSKSGEPIWIRGRGRALEYDQHGKPQRMIGTHSDITERKDGELKLEKAVQDLSNSNQELERFAYVASHDLQEPLRMVTTYMQVLKTRYADRLDDTALQYMGFAVDGAARMRVLINDLLSLSRINVKEKALSAIDCNDVIQDALSNLHVAIEETHPRIEVEEMPPILADRTQMTQLFQNLIGNAIKFRSERPLVISISASRANDVWSFRVQDNGIGIEEKYHERAFEIFECLHREGNQSGTGIGLALCKKIVEHRGGKIWFESEAGRGATVHFTLPDTIDGVMP